MLNPITGDLDYMSKTLDIMVRVKSLIQGLHMAYMHKGSNSPDVIYVASHKKEMIEQLEKYRDEIYSGHELIDSINSCIKDLDYRKKFFTKEVSEETLLELLNTAMHMVNSTIDAFNASIKLLDSLDLVEEKNKLMIERIV